ncbi:hypothetical protein OIU84_020282, partial [Salix udensis]
MLGCWNIRGLNGSNKHKYVHDWVVKNNLKVISLLETKVLEDNMSAVEHGLNLHAWKFLSNGIDGTAARIIVGWDPGECDVQCIKMVQQLVSCKINFKQTNKCITASFVYGLHTPADRTSLWAEILMLSRVYQDQAWLLLGDFNATLKASDSKGGDVNWSGHKMEFGNCLTQAQLSPLPYKGL